MIALFGGLACSGIAADELALNDNPYEAISVRNVFNLNPVIVNTTPNQPEPPVKITPNGIMTIFGKLQVLFKTSGGKANKDQSYILTEGQREDDIEVVKIDDDKGAITFNNHGIVQTLTLVPATASSGSAPAATATGFPSPVNNNNNNGFAARGRFGNFPGRRNRTNESSAENPDANDASNLRNIPTRNYQPPQSNLTPEEQVIMIEAQREYYRQQHSPIANILPPTSMTQPAGGTGGTGMDAQRNFFPGQGASQPTIP
ncbi:MAG TPA: hypothetical protein VFV23_12290 [Verrucomicrobiae bacterium]|nr:hypothetical protein [Verrucomicrobiae bacterium]